MINVAIVGAGPAGSSCAYNLAKHGIYPSLFDHSHPREKSCGGLVSSMVEELFPQLKQHPIEHSERNSMRLIAPSGRTITLDYRNGRMLGFSRLKFDQYLLKLAVNEGANLIEEKVLGLERKQGWWKVHTETKSYAVKMLVGADGANSLVRRNTIGSLSRRNRGICFVNLMKGLEKENMTIKFIPAFKGYVWVIPRAENTSIGGGSTDTRCFNEVKNEVNAFVSKYYPQAEKISERTAIIPNIKDTKVLRIPIAGSNWILIGDAAGHVNPISGGGIIYALLDGEKAAEAIAQNHPEMFNKLWVEAYGQGLFRDTKLRGWIYKRSLLELYCMYMKVSSILPFA
jgi:digeranylgeranylglycerophospholipid reductase